MVHKRAICGIRGNDVVYILERVEKSQKGKEGIQVNEEVEKMLRKYESFKQEYEAKMKEAEGSDFRMHQITLDYSPVLNMIARQLAELMLPDIDILKNIRYVPHNMQGAYNKMYNDALERQRNAQIHGANTLK